jgi:hypothetical protein
VRAHSDPWAHSKAYLHNRRAAIENIVDADPVPALVREILHVRSDRPSLSSFFTTSPSITRSFLSLTLWTHCSPPLPTMSDTSSASAHACAGRRQSPWHQLGNPEQTIGRGRPRGLKRFARISIAASSRTSSSAIATDLNARGIAAPVGGQWFPMQVRRVRDRSAFDSTGGSRLGRANSRFANFSKLALNLAPACGRRCRAYPEEKRRAFCFRRPRTAERAQ